MSTNEKDHMGKMFRATYYLVKSNQAFKKFTLLIELEELKGIKFLESYKNDKSVCEVIINIAENFKKVTCCNFFRVCTNGQASNMSNKSSTSSNRKNFFCLMPT